MATDEQVNEQIFYSSLNIRAMDVDLLAFKTAKNALIAAAIANEKASALIPKDIDFEDAYNESVRQVRESDKLAVARAKKAVIDSGM